MSGAPRWSFALVVGPVLGIACAVAAERLVVPAGPTEQLGSVADGGPYSTNTAAAFQNADAIDAAADGASSDGGDSAVDDDLEPQTLAEQRERLYKVWIESGVSKEMVAKARAIFEASPYLGQGNPEVTWHPMMRSECRKRRSEAEIVPGAEAECGDKYMVPIFDPASGETRKEAKVCIDQYEFPNVPCEYPVVNVQANEAAALCRAFGKRLCDAHEWEGACAGRVLAAESEYIFEKDRRYSSDAHNKKREIVWAYGPKKDYALCGTDSERTKKCTGGGWKQCGSNTYPTGAFPECKSSFGVYDQHGNAAEHMNLPILPEQLMSKGSEGGVTEMKGSWFIFSKGEPHVDDCRWRAPAWHESRVNDPGSHRNYHLGFRCCKDI